MAILSIILLEASQNSANAGNLIGKRSDFEAGAD
jgi:hypothetical protein